MANLLSNSRAHHTRGRSIQAWFYLICTVTLRHQLELAATSKVSLWKASLSDLAGDSPRMLSGHFCILRVQTGLHVKYFGGLIL